MTVRLPSRLIDDARRLKVQDESFNDLMVEALRHELRRRRGLQAYAEIQHLRKRIEDWAGAQPDSVTLLRALREQGAMARVLKNAKG